MSSSLIPEKPLLVSPSLAATIGLEEAAMLAVLNELAEHRPGEAQDGYNWLELDEQVVGRYMPFWTPLDVQRVSKSLRDKGIILLNSAPFTQSGRLRFAFNERPGRAPAEAPRPRAHNTPVRGANRIPPNWQPSDDVWQQLAQRNIPQSFAQEQLPEFITYWRERDEPAHAWGAKFLRSVLHAWRNHETDFRRRETASPMDSGWRPSHDAMEVLVKHAGINQQFVEDAVAEFVLYWQERGESSRTWNSKFIQHVRRQWNRYTATVENDTVPKPIPADWQPSEDVYDVLRLANIDISFAQGLLKEFVIFWRDNKQVQSSWNTKFLQHVKFHWARSHALSTESQSQHNAGKVSHSKTRERSLVDDLTDRSWAY
ncbi:DnaT-like ssDNA-binding domain-containing protein [Gilvimarinus sp. F26214L]|uniref:DnaT-like ssDNA-binding domain-containing protein n=1 Tax=Gilvimarinus sp. DZF01 TaxID=3461371 RepID=UPI004045ABD6